MNKKFEAGTIVMTRGVAESVNRFRVIECVRLHLAGNWGVVSEADKAANDAALEDGDRLLSAYPIDPAQPCGGHGDNCIWIITEWDRSVTTVLLPEEY